jgi:hypothetical protein
MSVKIIYICHNEKLINELQSKYDNPTIIFVGNSEVKIENPNIIIARNLINNIENEPKLLTFTAWYLIAKNNLFTEYDYLCLLEYDVILEANFENNLIKECAKNENHIISFIPQNNGNCFLCDINYNIFNNYLISKNIHYNTYELWYSTTNHCIKREILLDFVDWYYPSYLQIKALDYTKLSWYHERLFSAYLNDKKTSIKYLPGLQHIQLNSHNTFNT